MSSNVRAAAMVLAVALAAAPDLADACSLGGNVHSESWKEAELVIEGVVRGKRGYLGESLELVEVTRVYKGNVGRWLMVQGNSCFGTIAGPGASIAFLRNEAGPIYKTVDSGGHSVTWEEERLREPGAQTLSKFGAELYATRYVAAKPWVAPPEGRTVLYLLWHQPWLVLIWVLAFDALCWMLWYHRKRSRLLATQRNRVQVHPAGRVQLHPVRPPAFSRGE